MSSVAERSRVRTVPLNLSRQKQVPLVTAAGLDAVKQIPAWRDSFVHLRKDSRYFEIVAETICPQFQHRFFVIRDLAGQIRAIQPFFTLDQDLLAGAGSSVKALAGRIRRLWPNFLVMKTLMVGCAAGEAHLNAVEETARCRDAGLLAETIVEIARSERASLIVLKEFPATYRNALECFRGRGFTRIPSMPMTRLDIAYRSFDEYMTKALKSATRKGLRKKFRAADQAGPIALEVIPDASDLVEEIYPLYLQVFQRSKLQFEQLTKAYFQELGRRMPDKVRFFLWRKDGKLIAFALCMIEGDALFGEYIGFDYAVALDLHLYHYVMRDVISWGIANGFKSLRSSGLNYAPKLQMRHVLEPLDLYVRHTSPVVNSIMKLILPWLEPTRHDKTLKLFPNYNELWSATPVGAASEPPPPASQAR